MVTGVQLLLGRGGLVSTAPDYYRFTATLCNRGGKLDGTRLLKRKPVEPDDDEPPARGQELTELAQAGMLTEAAHAGASGPGFSLMQSPARAQILAWKIHERTVTTARSAPKGS